MSLFLIYNQDDKYYLQIQKLLLLNFLILSFLFPNIHELLFSLIFVHWLINQNKLVDKGHLYLLDISYQMLKLILNNIQIPVVYLIHHLH